MASTCLKLNNKSALRIFRIIILLAFVFSIQNLNAQDSFDKAKREKNDKKGTNVEYYKNGSIKSVSQYKRKVFWYYTETYWTIKEYDMDGNLVRMIKKVIQQARRENAETIIKEEVHNYEPKKENEHKENIRPE
jgi:hypothetical protein